LDGVVGFVGTQRPANDLSGIRRLTKEQENKVKTAREGFFWSGRPGIWRVCWQQEDDCKHREEELSQTPLCTQQGITPLNRRTQGFHSSKILLIQEARVP